MKLINIYSSTNKPESQDDENIHIQDLLRLLISEINTDIFKGIYLPYEDNVGLPLTNLYCNKDLSKIEDTKSEGLHKIISREIFIPEKTIKLNIDNSFTEKLNLLNEKTEEILLMCLCNYTSRKSFSDIRKFLDKPERIGTLHGIIQKKDDWGDELKQRHRKLSLISTASEENDQSDFIKADTGIIHHTTETQGNVDTGVIKLNPAAGETEAGTGLINLNTAGTGAPAPAATATAPVAAAVSATEAETATVAPAAEAAAQGAEAVTEAVAVAEAAAQGAAAVDPAGSGP